jgi:hypothetical protein
MSAIATTHANPLSDDFDERPFPSQDATHRPLPLALTASRQPILAVEFRSRDGRSWNAVGGGTTVAAAIEWARESCPHGTTWYAIGWNDLYGE